MRAVGNYFFERKADESEWIVRGYGKEADLTLHI